MIENPWVLTDYDPGPDPDIECPHCGTGWYKDGDGGYESDCYHSTHAYGDPIHGNFCEECIMKASTIERAAAFIDREVKKDDEKFRTSYQIKSTILPRLILASLGADEELLNSRGYMDAYSCKEIYHMQMKDRPDLWQIEDIVEELYPDEYAEFLMDVEDGKIKEVK